MEKITWKLVRERYYEELGTVKKDVLIIDQEEYETLEAKFAKRMKEGSHERRRGDQPVDAPSGQSE